jgi:MFS family permease
VLVIASLGWVFDVFEGQLFVASMNEAMPDLLPPEFRQVDEATRALYVRYYNNITFGAFLVGGALGGVAFGVISDRLGRKRALTYTIVMYSAFTFVSAFSQTWWHMAICRFLVALGVGGEWAVASAMVAEVFPKRARAWSLAIFQASSLFGAYLAVAVGTFIIGNPALQSEQYPTLRWRLGFLVGVLPALLIIWVRMGLREPENWQRARNTALKDLSKKLGSLAGLFTRERIRDTLVGVGLASVGLATCWGIYVYGKDLMRGEVEVRYLAAFPETADSEAGDYEVEQLLGDVKSTLLERQADKIDLAELEQVLRVSEDTLASQGYHGLRPELLEQNGDPRRRELCELVVNQTRAQILGTHFTSIKRYEMVGMLLTVTGGALGLLFFGPLCEWLGRRGAFLFFQIGGVVGTLIAFQYVSGVITVAIALPFFGFLTLGMLGGAAVYFPELYPTRVRSTGAGFCFNVGRVLAAPILFISGWMQRDWGLTLEDSASWLSLLFVVGAILLLFARETKGQDLPE